MGVFAGTGGGTEGNGVDVDATGAVCERVGTGEDFLGTDLDGPSNAAACADLSMKDLNSYFAVTRLAKRRLCTCMHRTYHGYISPARYHVPSQSYLWEVGVASHLGYNTHWI